MVLTTLVFGGTIKATAMPGSPTDETKVPHYFGPNTNWALSPLREARAVVDITGGGGNGATAAATVDPQTGAITAITITRMPVDQPSISTPTAASIGPRSRQGSGRTRSP